jgi:hypothetical protein
VAQYPSGESREPIARLPQIDICADHLRVTFGPTQNLLQDFVVVNFQILPLIPGASIVGTAKSSGLSSGSSSVVMGISDSFIFKVPYPPRYVRGQSPLKAVVHSPEG